MEKMSRAECMIPRFDARMCVWERGGGGGVIVGTFGVIVVRVFEPAFQNLLQSYTWPLKKKTDPFIY